MTPKMCNFQAGTFLGKPGERPGCDITPPNTRMEGQQAVWERMYEAMAALDGPNTKQRVWVVWAQRTPL